MMKPILKKLLLLLCFTYAFSTEITDYNIFEREDRVDVMISFDSPYNGSISKQSGEGYVNLLLNDIYIKDDIEQVFNNPSIQTLKIYQDGANVNILVGSKEELSVIASKSAEGYGLRLRFTTKSGILKSPQDSNIEGITKTTQNREGTPIESVLKTEGLDYRHYMSVFGVLLVLIGVLLYIKRRVPTVRSGTLPIKNSWLFGGKDFKKEDIKLISQKYLEPKTKVMIVEIYKKRYALLVTPTSSTLIDRVGDEKDEEIHEDNRFQSMLNENKEKLQEYLSIEDKRFEELKRQAGRDISLFDS